MQPRIAKGGYFQAEDGSKAADWELPARTGKLSQVKLSVGEVETIEALGFSFFVGASFIIAYFWC